MTPHVSGDVVNATPVDVAAEQVDRRRRGELVQVVVDRLVLDDAPHVERLLVRDQTN